MSRSWDAEQVARFGCLKDIVPGLEYIVRIAAGRAKIIELYSGDPRDEWFLLSLLEHTGFLLEYRSGISFVRHITEKMTYTCTVWLQALSDKAAISQLLQRQAGCQFIYDLLTRFPGIVGIVIHMVIIEVKENATEHVLELIVEMIRRWPQERAFESLEMINYSDRKDLIPLLVELLNGRPTPNAIAGGLRMMEDVWNCARHVERLGVLEVLMIKINEAHRDRIFAQVQKGIERKMDMTENECALVVRLLPTLSLRQVISLLYIMRNMIETCGKNEYFGKMLEAVLWASPSDERCRFLETSGEKVILLIEKEGFDEIVEFLKYEKNKLK